jgi:hypothetical protein
MSAQTIKQYDHKEVATLLIKEQGLHEGNFDLAFEFQIAVGAVGPNPESLLPGAMLGIGKITLSPAAKPGPSTVDAAIVNPKPAASSSRTKRQTK